ncbi:MAG: hypothetical protein P8J37_18815 [Fuerstiella sp.]|nr:hypothetical protein [Fuerstiella sp.]
MSHGSLKVSERKDPPDKTHEPTILRLKVPHQRGAEARQYLTVAADANDVNNGKL